MEAAMYKYLATIAGALVILSGALLVTNRAEAGASASAPSKNQHANQLASTQQTNRQARSSDFGITEYSSSSARKSSQH
jgi:hypothetical protein